MNPLRSYFRLLYVAIGLTSAAVIAFQILLTQILSIVQWYHFAFMVVSLAMLGFGASGTIIAVFRKKLLPHTIKLLPVLLILTGFFMSLSVWLLLWEPFRFDSYLLFVEQKQFGKLLLNLFVFCLPFLTSGMAAGLVFYKFVPRIGKLYFIDLIGAGGGGLLSVILLMMFLPSQTVFVAAMLPVLAGLMLLNRRLPAFLTSTLLLVGTLTLVSAIFSPVLPYSQYKSISKSLQLPGATIEFEGGSPHGFVQILASDALRYAPGLSLAFTGKVPVKHGVFNNGDWFGAVWAGDPEKDEHLMKYSTSALPYRLLDQPSVLFLEAGTGMGISLALNQNAAKVTATEPHAFAGKAIRNLLDTIETVNYLDHPDVYLHNVHSRAFLARNQEIFDLISIPLIGEFGGGAGLKALHEEYNLTVNAFSQTWQHLNDDGIIETSVWLDYPYRAPLKLLATLKEMLESQNVDNVHDHLFAIRSWGIVSFYLKKSPLTDEDIKTIREFCSEMYFDPVLLPELKDNERSGFNSIEDPVFFEMSDRLLTENRKDVQKEYPFYISPSTDNRPYFSQFLKWSSLPHLRELFGDQTLPFLELGYVLVVVTFAGTALISVLLILLPLLKAKRSAKGRGFTLVYFICIGTGFMFAEIILIQQFVLLFGQPAYAFALVLTALLISSGIGSLYSNAFSSPSAAAFYSCGVLAVILGIYSMYLLDLLQILTAEPRIVKVITGMFIIGIPGFFMGIPFPSGLRYLSKHMHYQIPWAWGINGCVSVLSAALALFLSVEAGFGVVMFLAGVSYFVVALLNVFFSAR